MFARLATIAEWNKKEKKKTISISIVYICPLPERTVSRCKSPVCDSKPLRLTLCECLTDHFSFLAGETVTNAAYRRRVGQKKKKKKRKKGKGKNAHRFKIFESFFFVSFFFNCATPIGMSGEFSKNCSFFYPLPHCSLNFKHRIDWLLHFKKILSRPDAFIRCISQKPGRSDRQKFGRSTWPNDHP